MKIFFKKFLKYIKQFISSSIYYSNKLFNQKKLIDSMYNQIIKEKSIEIKELENNLKSALYRNETLDHNISKIKNITDEREKLIQNIQNLTSMKQI
ncbi:hypothetical protein H2684_03235 [Clostridium sp. cel8]|jgi:hypothetical protein|uniref:hypothetical protein n=1 Tax=unclassified Clostridium TaxID=2614128 RepID=UPI0015F605CB|nr:hypothetical protein [Clostridium sp. cel8]MBA5850331.1 hypothetical protein [Clostridium sp. cel8]